MGTVLIQGTDNGEALEALMKEQEDRHMKSVIENTTPPIQQLSDILSDVQIRAMNNYGRYLQKKHPNWNREKIAKKSAALYNIKLV